MAEEMMSVPAARRERSDVTGLFIVLAFAGLTGLLGAAGLVSWWIFPRSVHPGFIGYPVAPFPAPKLEASPHQDFVRFYRHELDRLNSIGWVHKSQGIAHIPIEQAMAEVVKAGIPDWPTGPVSTAAAASGKPPTSSKPPAPVGATGTAPSAEAGTATPPSASAPHGGGK